MMLASYYSKNADFKELFDKLEISKSSSYKEHLNKHNVIYMTFNQIPNTNCTYEDFIGRYTSFLLKDLKEICPEIEVNEKMLLSDMFDHIYQKQANDFIFILDEWDYIFNNNLFSENDRKAF